MKRPLVLLMFLLGGIILFNAGFAVYLRPLLYTLTPLQRYYLDAYLASSWKAGDPAAQTDIQWIWKFKAKETEAKTGSRAKAKAKNSDNETPMEFAREGDLVPRPASDLLWGGDRLPFTMSPQAAADGWLGISKGMPVHVNAAQVEPVLREGFFDGKPAWRFFVQPALMLAAAFLLWLVYRAREAVYLEQNWWKAVPLWVRLGRKALAIGSGAAKSLQAPLAQLALPTPTRGPVILEQTAPQLKAKPDSKPVPVAPSVPPVQAAKSAAPAASPVQPKATFWDESKGLD